MSDDEYPPREWKPRHDQMGIWYDLQEKIPNVYTVAHRQWGKDEIFLRDDGLSALEEPASYVYCLPQTNQVRRNMWEAINPRTGVNRIDEAFPRYIRGKKLDQSMTIHIPVLDSEKYSTVTFTGSDNYDALRGMVGKQYTFSEWAFCDPNALGVVRPIVEANNGRLRFVTTPKGQNHAYKMLVNNAAKPDWRCYLITNNTEHVLMRDKHAKGIIHIQSHAVSAERMKAVLEENIDLYGPEIGQSITDQEYECSFEEIAPGSFYLDLILKAERDGRITSIAPRPDLPVYAGFDLGFTDPTAIWFFQVKPEGWIDFVGYDEITRTSAPELVPDLRRRPWYYAALLFPHDGPHHEFTSGTTAEQIFTTAGFSVMVMPRTDDGAQIPSVRTLLPRCRFANLPEVHRGLDCLRHYHNKAKTEGGKTSWSPRPVHDWSSHGAKAMATVAYFAPELSSSVRPPIVKAKDPFAHIGGRGAGGWMG